MNQYWLVNIVVNNDCKEDLEVGLLNNSFETNVTIKQKNNGL